jgi:hypothetical protein
MPLLKLFDVVFWFRKCFLIFGCFDKELLSTKIATASFFQYFFTINPHFWENNSIFWWRTKFCTALYMHIFNCRCSLKTTFSRRKLIIISFIKFVFLLSFFSFSLHIWIIAEVSICSDSPWISVSFNILFEKQKGVHQYLSGIAVGTSSKKHTKLFILNCFILIAESDSKTNSTFEPAQKLHCLDIFRYSKFF